MTDPISDMLTRIRNASAVSKPEARIPYSKTKFAVAKILAAAGYVASAEKSGEGVSAEIAVGLKYDGRTSAIRSLKRVSTPGRRVYSKYNDLPRVLSDQGLAIVSTSQGIMTNKEARRRKLGGEVICEVY